MKFAFSDESIAVYGGDVSLEGELEGESVVLVYQACDDTTCLLPRTERLSLELPLDVVDIPSVSLHRGHGQREGRYDGTPHLRRLLLRKLRKRPLALPKFLWKNLRLELQARGRRRRST